MQGVAVLTAWAVTAATSALAALYVARAALAVRQARECQAARLRLEAEVGLAALAMARAASGAIRLTPSGTLITVGSVPGAVAAALTSPSSPGALERAVTRLLSTGEGFRQAIAPSAPEPRNVALEPRSAAVVVGTLEGGHPTLFVEPAARPTAAATESGVAARLQQLLRALPHPVWVSTADGDRVWANDAYARAVSTAPGATAARAAATRERGDQATVATAGVGVGETATVAEPLLDANATAQLAASSCDGVAHERVPTVVAGERRLLDVTADQRDGMTAALAIDVTEVAQQLTVQARSLESHAATFDRLATAIAIYGPDRRLVFHNAAFATLWEFPPAFLEQMPQEERVLDRLRAERRLPETADFQAWKREQLKGYETRQTFERWWHLPDGQTLRVIANPGADGGVTYIYENVTEQLALERQYNALSRVQAETIDNLGEGIASFGPDGLLRLANPAFWTLTRAAPAEVGAHVRAIATRTPAAEAAAWEQLVQRVTGLTDHRVAVSGRIERTDGHVLDYAFAPLPDGSTLATFADVTDTVNVARALVERNTALVAADRLKNAFIEHVSYELRSPLNVIIGYSQLLSRVETSDLPAKQRDWSGYIATSSEALLVIIDGILDLASIDAGIMELTLAPVDVAEAARQVLDGLKDRIAEGGLDIRVAIADDAATFDGDALRVRQILFNLLSNAVSHSPPGGTIAISSWRDGDALALAVRDHGPGIAQAKAEAVFERFHTSGAAGRRGGVGLGLSLVKSFVELHGGTVSVAPVDGSGAELVVRFPRFSAGVLPSLRIAG